MPVHDLYHDSVGAIGPVAEICENSAFLKAFAREIQKRHLSCKLLIQALQKLNQMAMCLFACLATKHVVLLGTQPFH